MQKKVQAFLLYMLGANCKLTFVGAIGGGEIFNDGAHNSVLSSVMCKGDEETLLECNNSTTSGCGDRKDAHVVCQGKYFLYSCCTKGQL